MYQVYNVLVLAKESMICEVKNCVKSIYNYIIISYFPFPILSFSQDRLHCKCEQPDVGCAIQRKKKLASAVAILLFPLVFLKDFNARTQD